MAQSEEVALPLLPDPTSKARAPPMDEIEHCSAPPPPYSSLLVTSPPPLTAAPPPVTAATTNTVIIHNVTWMRHPQNGYCAYCNDFVRTNIRHTTGTMTWLFFLICMLICWPLCWIPFCMDGSKDVEHYCSKCNNFLARNKR